MRFGSGKWVRNSAKTVLMRPNNGQDKEMDLFGVAVQIGNYILYPVGPIHWAAFIPFKFFQLFYKFYKFVRPVRRKPENPHNIKWPVHHDEAVKPHVKNSKDICHMVMVNFREAKNT